MTISTTVKLAKEKGAKYYKDRDFLESIKEYSIAIDNGDSNDNELHLYYSNRCACYLQIAKYNEARDDAESCTMIKPNWPKGFSRLGSSLLKLNKVPEAVNAFERAAELDPNNSETAASLDSARMNLTGRNFNSSNSSSSPRSSSSSSTRASDSSPSESQPVWNQANSILNTMKQYFSKAIAQIVLFYTQMTDQQKIYVVIALLGVLFYFLFNAGNTSRGGSVGGFGGRNGFSSQPYDMNRPDAYTNTPRTDARGSKNYNDQYPRYDETDHSRYDDRGSDRAHRSGNRYNGNQNYRSQNYGFDTSYGLSWPLWGAIIAGAYKLPPYFEAQLGPEYARPFFGMTFMSFTMLLNMLSNSMRGRRGGSGLFGSAFNRRRRF